MAAACVVGLGVGLTIFIPRNQPTATPLAPIDEPLQAAPVLNPDVPEAEASPLADEDEAADEAADEAVRLRTNPRTSLQLPRWCW